MTKAERCDRCGDFTEGKQRSQLKEKNQSEKREWNKDCVDGETRHLCDGCTWIYNAVMDQQFNITLDDLK